MDLLKIDAGTGVVDNVVAKRAKYRVCSKESCRVTVYKLASVRKSYRGQEVAYYICCYRDQVQG